MAFLSDSFMQSLKDGSLFGKMPLIIRSSIDKGVKIAQKRITGRLDYFLNWCMIHKLEKVTLYVKGYGPGFMDDDYVDYNDAGKPTAIHRMAVSMHDLDKIDRTNIDIALSFLKFEHVKIADLYIKHGDMDDHYYEFNRDGKKHKLSERLQQTMKVKQLT